ncbi:MAG: HEPN domain-containing protein [Prevotella sp.]|nr:HEPN domain-containing protein [Prevotella sp.]
MESKITKYRKDLESLINRGTLLYYGLYNEFSSEFKVNKLDKETQEKIKKCSFKDNYNSWYNESLALIKHLMPERLEDFVAYYKLPKRKSLTYETYTISDYLVSLMAYDAWGKEKFKASTIRIKYDQQFQILKSLETRFSSSLYDIKQLLQADLFDSEIDAAKELCKKGFYRASGAICGVIIEKHLSEVCIERGINISKKNPVINDYNQLLKDNAIIDTPTWRFIQRLGDLRNLCDHQKSEEPTEDKIKDLIDGTDKIIKTIL